MLTDTVSIIEVLWTVIVVIGSVIGFKNSMLVYEDLHFLRGRKDFIKEGPRHIVAKSRLRGEVMKLGAMFGFILIGLVAMTQPNVQPNGVNIASIVASSVFILFAIAFVFDSVMYGRDRDKHREFYLTNLPKTQREAREKGDLDRGV